MIVHGCEQERGCWGVRGKNLRHRVHTGSQGNPQRGPPLLGRGRVNVRERADGRPEGLAAGRGRGKGRGGGMTLGAAASFSGVICSMDRPLTWTKLSSRAASSAFTASFTRERATKFPKKLSNSD